MYQITHNGRITIPLDLWKPLEMNLRGLNTCYMIRNELELLKLLFVANYAIIVTFNYPNLLPLFFSLKKRINR